MRESTDQKNSEYEQFSRSVYLARMELIKLKFWQIISGIYKDKELSEKNQ